MAGSPSEAELQTQWRNAIDLLEQTRTYIDGTVADNGGLFDVLEQSLEGDFTPVTIANAVARYRATMSSLVDPATVREFINPIIFDYAKILAVDATDGFGSNYTRVEALFSAIYEWFHANSLTVESRNITYDTTATEGASNVGVGVMTRLTVDHNNYNLEACHPERKIFRCRSDAASGVDLNAETFEMAGTQSSQDALLRAVTHPTLDTHKFGSGIFSSTLITSRNAGSGVGGSLCANSSFSQFTVSTTSGEQFSGWEETLVGAAATTDITQDTTNFYRTHPGASTNASCSLAVDDSNDRITLKQTLSNMRINRLDPNSPYFLRVMVNKTIGTGVGGSVRLRLGNQTVSSTTAALAANWTEMMIPADTNTWFRNFNEATFDVEIEWDGGTSGTMLFDDLIFAPYTLIDGTWWILRPNNSAAAAPGSDHTAWQVDDTLSFTDEDGLPAIAKIQYWNFVAGYGHLPSTTGVPTFTEP